MFTIPVLKPNDQVELIAPASRCSEERLQLTQQMLTSWGLQCIVNPSLFGSDLLCANSDFMRSQLLIEALTNPDNKAIICLRGGYGSMRLIPELHKIKQMEFKLFIGMSDITALNLFFMQKWKWPVLHGGIAPDYYTLESLARYKSYLFGEINQLEFQGSALNQHALKNNTISSTITGGNLCLLQASIGTTWEIDTQNKFVFIEEVGERGYRIDRMLEHLTQTGIFSKAQGIILGDFTGGNEPDGSSLIQPVLERFAQAQSIPVFQIKGVGHDSTNFPLPLGIPAHIHLGDTINLTVFR
ncbi:LD-carboxypeptidase [Legionella adelaidensis]|uniref:LD-carboxypeptidase n=1 Tax=Legionella adelaidensis TaxID=45056 RepID=A0A0W0R3V8_9GAMM|nr:LD-carboxypeptidase [Legionella adelaidensis]KTC65761.1 LD-carboxypeptidase [Legionella adelaidensis]